MSGAVTGAIVVEGPATSRLALCADAVDVVNARTNAVAAKQ
jgi:hypothetical protein